MHTEDSALERTPDLVKKIRALRDQAQKEMDRFTDASDYDVRRVVGRKPKTEVSVPPPQTAKKGRGKKVEQVSIDFSASNSQTSADAGEQE
jgi:hypothetical protein